ncbi:hypothetical protein RFI_19030, partial [Reticulomyxa filosa]
TLENLLVTFLHPSSLCYKYCCSLLGHLSLRFISICVLQNSGSFFNHLILNASIKNKITEENQNKWYGILFAVSLSLFIVSIVLLALFFGWYANDSGCTTHETFISLSIVFVLANGVVSIWAGQLFVVCSPGTFFVSALVSAYSTFLCFAALQSDSNENCNRYFNKRSTASLWIGIIFALLSLCYAALTSNLLHSLVGANGNSEMNEALLDDKQNGEKQKESNANEKEGDEESQNYTEEAEKRLVADSNYNDLETDNKTSAKIDNEDSITSKKAKREAVYFHVIMTLAAGYMG